MTIKFPVSRWWHLHWYHSVSPSRNFRRFRDATTDSELRVRGHYTEFCETRLIKSQRLMISGLLITKLCISHCMVYEKQIMVWSNFTIKPGIHCAIFIRFWAEYWLVRLFFESGQISALSCVVCRAVFVQCTGGNEEQLASPDRQSDGRMNFWFWSPLVSVSHNWSKATNRLP